MNSPDEERIDFILADIKKELMNRQTFKVEAIIHSVERNFADVLPNSEYEDGCIVLYLDGSTRERLYEDLKSRVEPEADFWKHFYYALKNEAQLPEGWAEVEAEALSWQVEAESPLRISDA
jgi:hypothetical protein